MVFAADGGRRVRCVGMDVHLEGAVTLTVRGRWLR